MNTYQIALESARTEEFVRMVNVCVEMDTEANSVSKKVSDFRILIFFFSVCRFWRKQLVGFHLCRLNYCNACNGTRCQEPLEESIRLDPRRSTENGRGSLTQELSAQNFYAFNS